MSGTTPFDCPRCGVVLTMSERQGIEIDYCPQCRGVWLDRGELDKIIGMSETVGQAPPAAQPTPGLPAGGWIQPDAPPPPAQQPWGGEHRGHHDDAEDDDERRDYGHGGERRSSWLKNLFD
jgi:Zn-finger nucleic acid-binding protein